MQTIHLQAMVGTDGQLHLDVPCQLPPGPAEVVVVVGPMAAAKQEVRWADFYGVGKEAWQGIDAQEYVNQLRIEDQ